MLFVQLIHLSNTFLQFIYTSVIIMAVEIVPVLARMIGMIMIMRMLKPPL